MVSAGRRELQEDRMELAAELTAAGLAVEYGCAAPPAARARGRAPTRIARLRLLAWPGVFGAPA